MSPVSYKNRCSVRCLRKKYLGLEKPRKEDLHYEKNTTFKEDEAILSDLRT
jgi:hypothetical protein